MARELRTGDSDITIGPRYSRICSFGIKTPLKGGARRGICEDWHNLRSAGEQQRWAYLFNTGLISKEEADAWVEEVWPSEIDTCVPAPPRNRRRRAPARWRRGTIKQASVSSADQGGGKRLLGHAQCSCRAQIRHGKLSFDLVRRFCSR
jgi:hypothetical protein